MTAAEVVRGRRLDEVRGPLPMRLVDIDAVNQAFSDAFTERYRRDGMMGVRVPFLNPAIWRYALESAREGAMLWRDGRDQVVAFNVAHSSGSEGWMGPLAVRPEFQGSGLGKVIVQSGIDYLKRCGARVIGLETMPRTMDNIGFYARLGFVPGRLTITVAVDAAVEERPVPLLGVLAPRARSDMLVACRDLTNRVAPGLDFTREVEATRELSLGDVVLLRDDAGLEGFALYHAVPLVDGRGREELRVLKMVLRDEGRSRDMGQLLQAAARQAGTKRASIRLQGEYPRAFRELIALGARVKWTDLRMSLTGFPESRPIEGLVISNWEI